MHVPSVVGSKVTLLAEDGNKLPGNPRVQNEVLLTAGKTTDATIQPTVTNGTYDAATYAVFDRALSLSTSNQRDGGMQAYISVSGGAPAGTAGSSASAAALSVINNKSFYCTAGSTLAVTDPSKGVLGGATGANGAVLSSTVPPAIPPGDTLSFHSDGTFTYKSTGSACGGTFTFLVNGGTTAYTATIADCSTASTCKGGAPTAGNGSFTSNVASRLVVAPPGVLAFATSPGGLPLTAVPSATASSCSSVMLNADGSFTAINSAALPTCSFNYKVSTSTNQTSAEGTITVNFLAPSNLLVNVYDAPSQKPGSTPVKITDYRWIIEEDRTLWIDPKCQINTTGTRLDSRGNLCPPLPVEALGYNFHTANMPVIAQGCTGAVSCEGGQTVQGSPASCDIGDGACRAQQDVSGLGVPVDAEAGQKFAVDPRSVHLDPNKRYFISILPGDGVNPTIGGAGGPDDSGKPFDIAAACGPYVLDTSLTGTSPWAPGAPSAICGHAMGGAQISPVQVASAGTMPINIGLQETPLPTSKIAVLVFQDDNPLNGENDAGGGVDVLAPNEAGLGGFNLELFDQAGGLGDATGQITYDMFNQPVSNSLAGKIDPITGLDSCPITARNDGAGGNFVGMIPVCPKYESDGKTLSPLAGQAVIANLYPGLYEVTATPGADRIGRGEEWLQTNTLDGGKPHEAFIKPNEPGYFQEFGPGGFHVSIGFANPKIINDRKGWVLRHGAGWVQFLADGERVEQPHGPHARSAHVQQRQLRPLRLYELLRLGGSRGRRGLRVPEMQPGRKSHFQQHAVRYVQDIGIRPVERHHARRLGRVRVDQRQHHQGFPGHAVALEPVDAHLHRCQRRRRVAGRRAGSCPGQHQHPLSRRQLWFLQQYRPERLCGFQRSLPVHELAGGRDCVDPLQARGRAHRL